MLESEEFLDEARQEALRVLRFCADSAVESVLARNSLEKKVKQEGGEGEGGLLKEEEETHPAQEEKREGEHSRNMELIMNYSKFLIESSNINLNLGQIVNHY